MESVPTKGKGYADKNLPISIEKKGKIWEEKFFLAIDKRGDL